MWRVGRTPAMILQHVLVIQTITNSLQVVGLPVIAVCGVIIMILFLITLFGYQLILPHLPQRHDEQANYPINYHT